MTVEEKRRLSRSKVAVGTCAPTPGFRPGLAAGSDRWVTMWPSCDHAWENMIFRGNRVMCRICDNKRRADARKKNAKREKEAERRRYFEGKKGVIPSAESVARYQAEMAARVAGERDLIGEYREKRRSRRRSGRSS